MVMQDWGNDHDKSMAYAEILFVNRNLNVGTKTNISSLVIFTYSTSCDVVLGKPTG